MAVHCAADVLGLRNLRIDRQRSVDGSISVVPELSAQVLLALGIAVPSVYRRQRQPHVESASTSNRISPIQGIKGAMCQL